MQKELNQELFGTNLNEQGRYKEKETPNTYRAAQHVEEKITEVKQNVHGLAEKLANLVLQFNEYIKNTHQRFDRFQGQQKTFENQFASFKSEINQKFSLAHQRLNERKSMDMKMQELIDRHNSILRSYEVRLNQLQKLISEKDAQLAISQAALNESKMELSRLKRL